MSQPEWPQVQVEQLEAIVGQYLGATPPRFPPQQQIYNTEPSPPSRSRQPDDDDIIAGKAPPPSKCDENRERLEGWLLQRTVYFTITGTGNECQRLAIVGLCMDGKALDWWQAKKNEYSSCPGVQTGIGLYYRPHYCADRAHLEIHQLRQTGPVQDYVNEIDRLNTYAKIPDRAIINIIMNKLTGRLCRSMAHDDHLRENPAEWKKQLVPIDIITTEVQGRNKHHCQDDSKDRSKKRTFEDCIELKAGTEEKKKSSGNNRDFILQDQMDRRKKENHWFKCDRKNHQASDCE